MSHQNFELVSGLAMSDEKKTDAVTDFSSTSMPAFWHARAFLVLGAAREVRIEQGWPLPPQQAQRAAATAPRGLVSRRGLGLRDAGVHQQLGTHRGGEARGHHLLQEGPPWQATLAHLFYESTQSAIVHESLPLK